MLALSQYSTALIIFDEHALVFKNKNNKNNIRAETRSAGATLTAESKI